MNKRDKIDYILGLVKEQTEEFLEFEEKTGMEISVEDIIIASIEQVTSQTIERPQYNSPVGTVDRDKMQYVLDEELAVPIWSNDDTD
jgi:hypothetical protein